MTKPEEMIGFEIRRGVMPEAKNQPKRKTASAMAVEAAAKLKPGEHFVVPASSDSGWRYQIGSIRAQIQVNKCSYHGLPPVLARDIETYVALDGSLVVHRHGKASA